MNGMKEKSDRRKKSIRYTEDGLPRDVNDWTVEDWIDLHKGMEAIKRKIRQRHATKKDQVADK